MERMTITTSVALTLATTRALGDAFSDMHKAAEFLMGHPIWTHEFADKGLWDRMREAILAQHPRLTDILVGKETWEADLAAAVAVVGPRLEILSGQQERTEYPLDSLKRIAPDKPIIVVEVDHPSGEA